MDFKEWLTEMAHLQLNEPIDIKGKKVSFIDMRFELYPDLDRKQLTKWLISGFAAPVPDSDMWIVFDRKKIHPELSKSTQGKDVVPEDWWQRAYLDTDFNLSVGKAI